MDVYDTLAMPIYFANNNTVDSGRSHKVFALWGYCLDTIQRYPMLVNRQIFMFPETAESQETLDKRFIKHPLFITPPPIYSIIILIQYSIQY